MKSTTASIADDLDFQLSRPCCANQGLTADAMIAARDELRRLDARERRLSEVLSTLVHWHTECGFADESWWDEARAALANGGA